MPPTDETIVRDAPPSATAGYLPPRPDIIVTLVHGTILLARWPRINRVVQWLRSVFARPPRDSLWHEQGSKFTASLQKELARRASIRSFHWSGGNSVWDRLSAAGAYGNSADLTATKSRRPPSLREHIAAVATEHPEAAQVLIGHSHGASVCVAALHHQPTRKAVRALVSLSTPYVHVRQRTDASKLQTALSILGFLIYLTLLIGIPTWLRSRVGEPWNSFIFSIAFVGVVGLAALTLNRRRQRNAAVRAWSESVNEPASNDVARLVLISDGDEALLALKIAEALSSVARGLWRATYGIVELLERSVEPLFRPNRTWLVYFGAALALVEFFLLYDGQSPWGPNSGNEWTLWYAAKILIVSILLPPFIALILVLLLFVPALVAMLIGFPFLVFFRWLAFGWGGSLGVDVTAESLPLGRATAERLPAPADAVPGLRHSIYNDVRVPPLIAEFILGVVDAPAIAIGSS